MQMSDLNEILNSLQLPKGWFRPDKIAPSMHNFTELLFTECIKRVLGIKELAFQYVSESNEDRANGLNSNNDAAIHINIWESFIAALRNPELFQSAHTAVVARFRESLNHGEIGKAVEQYHEMNRQNYTRVGLNYDEQILKNRQNGYYTPLHAMLDMSSESLRHSLLQTYTQPQIGKEGLTSKFKFALVGEADVLKEKGIKVDDPALTNALIGMEVQAITQNLRQESKNPLLGKGDCLSLN